MLVWARLTVFLTLGLFARASFISTVLDAIESAVDCASCHALLTVLQGVAIFGDSVFSSALVGVCQAVNAEDDDVCKGLLTEQGPIIAHDLRSISSLGQTATKFCNAVIGLCQEPDVNSYTVPIPKAAPANPKVFTSTGKTPFQVVHFSDVHIDRSYTVGSEVNCTKPICCRNFADQSGPVEVPAGAVGSHGCDTSTALSQSMLKAVAAENTRFSIFTGDVVEAAVWLVDQTEVTSDLQTFNAEMAKFVNSPVFPAIAPINAFPRNTSSGAPSSQWVFDIQSQGWNQWVGTTASGEVQHMSGSYSAIPSGTNLRIISLNTIYWYKDNFWLYDSNSQQPDPNGILAFAVQQLQAAEDAGQRAWIIAHMPPSSGDAFKDQSSYFNQIVQRYKNTIAAQFYGHSHVDEFAIAYSDFSQQTAANANSIAYIAPSLTPRNANPAFRVYDVDPDTYEIMDSRTFSSDMSDPSFQTAPTWKQEYSARSTYGPAIGGWPSTQSLSPAFWHKVTEAFVSNDALFQQFNSFKTRGVGVVPCTGDCKTNTICNLRALRTESGCHTATPGLNFKRDEDVDLTARGHADHCEGTGVRSILGNIASKAVCTPLNFKSMDPDALRERLEAIFKDLE
ncbi:sphingomyelin phosphodiesterase [Pholiota conissans]|uniref:Sphingomyelin phosphodiesterase n=1 Tax=Pholiota conissans TaxID=109636 RepID=A0A9P5Z1R0_9AGAR|nr:sphingomyelin phosphodiesterase [Pholiota conissans]